MDGVSNGCNPRLAGANVGAVGLSESRSGRRVAGRRYDAFISYRRSSEYDLATTIYRQLRHIGRPFFALRSFELFRDDGNIAAGDALWSRIESALLASNVLVLILSPDLCKSSSVDLEIQLWRREKSARSIVLVLAHGDLVWDVARSQFDPVRSTALPASLVSVFDEQPLWLDLRWARASGHRWSREPAFRHALVALAARLRYTTPDEIEGLDRTARRRRLTVMGLLAVAALVLGVFAYMQTQEADQRRREARERELVVRCLSADPPTSLSAFAKVLATDRHTFSWVVERIPHEDGRAEDAQAQVRDAFIRVLERAAFAQGGRPVVAATSANAAVESARYVERQRELVDGLVGAALASGRVPPDRILLGAILTYLEFRLSGHVPESKRLFLRTQAALLLSRLPPDPTPACPGDEFITLTNPEDLERHQAFVSPGSDEIRVCRRLAHGFAARDGSAAMTWYEAVLFARQHDAWLISMEQWKATVAGFYPQPEGFDLQIPEWCVRTDGVEMVASSGAVNLAPWANAPLCGGDKAALEPFLGDAEVMSGRMPASRTHQIVGFRVAFEVHRAGKRRTPWPGK